MDKKKDRKRVFFVVLLFIYKLEGRIYTVISLKYSYSVDRKSFVLLPRRFSSRLENLELALEVLEEVNRRSPP